MVENPSDTTVIRDMSDYYNFRLSQILDNINELWDGIILDKTYIIYLSNELHKLYKQLHPKLKQHEKQKQMQFRKILNSLIPVRIKTVPDRENCLQRVAVVTPHYQKFRQIIEERELHLMECLERIGLTAKEVKIKKPLR